MSSPSFRLERTIYHADAIALLERLPDASYELVYLDPPFPQTGKFLYDSSKRPKLRDLNATLHEAMTLYAKVFLQVRRVLKPTGNLFVQLEPTSHGLTRVLLDAVFGRENFEREIVWIPRGKTAINQQHETISWYRRGTGNVKNDFRALTPEEVEAQTRHADDRGPYRHISLMVPARAGNSFQWRGYLPPDGQSWRFSRERLDQLEASGEIEHVVGARLPRQKQYLAELRVPVGSVWTDIASEAFVQKSGLFATTPLALAERMMQVGSNPGDRVLDPFCGTGTMLVAAERLGRSWTGGDASVLAVEETERRLRAECAVGLHVGTSEELKRSGAVVHAIGSVAVERLVEELAPAENSPLRGRYRLGEVLAVEEVREVEFKEVKGPKPMDAIRNTVDEYVVAFLNEGSGGRIFWGVADDGRVVGVVLDRSQRDEVRRVVTEKLATIQPPIPAGSYGIACHRVEGCAPEEERFVVEVRVPQVATTTLYFTGGAAAWVKTDGGKLRLGGLQIIDEILRRSRVRLEESAAESIE